MLEYSVCRLLSSGSYVMGGRVAIERMAVIGCSYKETASLLI